MQNTNRQVASADVRDATFLFVQQQARSDPRCASKPSYSHAAPIAPGDYWYGSNSQFNLTTKLTCSDMAKIDRSIEDPR